PAPTRVRRPAVFTVADGPHFLAGDARSTEKLAVASPRDVCGSHGSPRGAVPVLGGRSVGELPGWLGPQGPDVRGGHHGKGIDEGPVAGGRDPGPSRSVPVIAQGVGGVLPVPVVA